jgi:hypothetical protein
MLNNSFQKELRNKGFVSDTIDLGNPTEKWVAKLAYVKWEGRATKCAYLVNMSRMIQIVVWPKKEGR